MRRRRPVRVGRVWAVVEDRVVVEAERIPRLGAKLYTSSMEHVADTLSILGPVSRPFIEARQTKPRNLARGEPLYIMEEDEYRPRESQGIPKRASR